MARHHPLSVVGSAAMFVLGIYLVSASEVSLTGAVIGFSDVKSAWEMGAGLLLIVLAFLFTVAHQDE